MYPNHGEATVKIHYEGDTLVAVKVGLKRPESPAVSLAATADSRPPAVSLTAAALRRPPDA